MALRSRDNALPIAPERPKKVAKVVAAAASPAKKAALAEVTREPSKNDENVAPLPQAAQAEQSIEYLASHDLKPIADPESRITVLLDELNSKDWQKLCEALNEVRRFAVYHSALLTTLLNNVMIVITKAMKNPRSALCKTAIMASADIFHSFGPFLLSTLEETTFDQLLLQLLLKASQDKKFVCEEAENALETMAVALPPLPLLKRLQSYANHTNHRVRAKAAVALSKCVSKMDIELMKEFGFVILLQMAAELLNDRLPEAREAARIIICSIQAGYFTDKVAKDEDDELPGIESWQNFCSLNLTPISAQSVAKIVLQ